MPRVSNRREIIIDVATHRFLISGYDVVTVDEICDLTQSTKGSFYHFFANKESLAIDVINHVWHQTEAQLEEIFHANENTMVRLSAEIERVSSNYARFDGRRYFVGCPIGTLAVALRGRGPRLTRRLNFALTHMRQFYTEAFAEGIDNDEIILQDSAEEMADRFMIGLQGLTSLGKASSSAARIREMSRHLLAGLELSRQQVSR
jgi:TetR/AcrR family transcriptional repressor of nem operon